MKIGIIDDEKPNRQVIHNILTHLCPQEQVVAEEGSVNGAIKVLNEAKPDLVFLDIELKNGTGFDVINGLTYKPEIVFTTAYSQYAINAIKVRALDYLLKPINEDELLQSLNKFREKTQVTSSKIEKSNEPSFFHLATVEGKQAIRISEILYFESSGSYTYCITESARHIFSKNLGEVEKEINPALFFRTHHSYIVNISKISKLLLKRNGQVYLTNGVTIPVAQRKIKEFKVAIAKFSPEDFS